MRLKGWRSIVFALLALSLIGLGRPVAAQSTITHTVQPGENLFRIALYYGTTVDAIQSANNLGSVYINVGQKLVIPGATNVTPPEAPLTPPDAESEAPVADTEAESTPEMSDVDARSYQVQVGDTLFSIAARFDVSLWTLTQENGLSNWGALYLGQELIIPGDRADVAQEEDAPAPEEAPAPEGVSPEDQPSPEAHPVDEAPADADTPPAPAAETYTVQRGDTLTQIAARFGTSVVAISRLNGIANPSQIYVGQVLRLTGTAPAPSGLGKLIIINLNEQHLYAYQDEQLIYSFVVSTGRAPYYTRAGEFRVQSKIPNAYGSVWDIWMPNWLGIYWAGSTENGIHALPVTPGGQVLWGGYLGTPISFGCIVLGTEASQLLYNWAEIGTPVSIRY